MIDNAHSETDKKLEKMETYLTELYRKSAKGITKKWYEYMETASKKIEALQQDYDYAKSLGDKTLMKRAGKKLAKAKKDITIHNEYYKAMLDEVAFQLSHVNETATAYINNQLPEIYTINYNAVAPDVLTLGTLTQSRDLLLTARSNCQKPKSTFQKICGGIKSKSTVLYFKEFCKERVLIKLQTEFMTLWGRINNRLSEMQEQ